MKKVLALVLAAMMALSLVACGGSGSSAAGDSSVNSVVEMCIRDRKQHRFWAWGAVICMIMVMVTGYKRK